MPCSLPYQHCVRSVCMHLQWARQKFRYPAGTVRHPNELDRSLGTLQARYDTRTNPEPILSVQGRTNPERILNQSYWFVWPPFGYGSLPYVRIRSHLGSAEAILNKKCLQGFFPFTSTKAFCRTLSWLSMYGFTGDPTSLTCNIFLTTLNSSIRKLGHNCVSTGNKIRNIHINHM